MTMYSYSSLLILIFVLLSVTTAHEDSIRLANVRTLRYPQMVHRDVDTSILARDSSALEVSAVPIKNVIERNPETTVNADQCYEKNKNICAEFIIGTNTVSQQIRIDDNGCTPIQNAADITAINVFDCWCGIWNAASDTACNNGDDERVDQFNNCAGLKTRKERGWKWTPTHVSCFRL
ncbi:hypothetical protein BKA66DRAFT_55397 [Pyrenochaeta sp. MPI-SDFR-AT-0127]|nr:hypothetical protein BKA66DRAFT_55397 [Pyrenochaeta sp. MPI-SDFR-AT-0127]